MKVLLKRHGVIFVQKVAAVKPPARGILARGMGKSSSEGQDYPLNQQQWAPILAAVFGMKIATKG